VTPEHRAELAKLEDIAGEVSLEYHQYIEKIARPIKGGAAGERAFLCLLAVRKWEAAQSPLDVLMPGLAAALEPKRRGRPPKGAA
jgi:hypothetical protein